MEEIKMERIVQRLRNEKIEQREEHEKEIYEDGKKGAWAWAEDADLEDIQYLHNWNPSDINEILNEDTMGGYFTTIFEVDFQKDEKEFDVWFKGWKEGIDELWRKI